MINALTSGWRAGAGKRGLLALLGVLVTLSFSAAALADPIVGEGYGLPFDASRDGHRIDWLIEVTNIFVILLALAMCVWILYAVFKHNQDHKADYDHGDSKHHVAVAMGVSAIIFFVVDGNLWFNSTVDVNTVYWNFEESEKHPDAVRIEINAHQWAWDARYAGPDNKFNTADDVVTLNDIRVPNDVPVLFQIASTDVIHSFSLPNFRVKQDAMPGMVTRMRIWPAKIGEYDIGCTQHCGTNHYKMKGRLTVMSKADYASWHKAMSMHHARGFDAKDIAAHWGWDWKRSGNTVKAHKDAPKKTAAAVFE